MKFLTKIDGFIDKNGQIGNLCTTSLIVLNKDFF